MTPPLMARRGGVWVETDLTGKAGYGGLSVPYGPSGGPTYETLDWPAPPAFTNLDDGPTQVYNMGVAFDVLTPGQPCAGVQWRVPDTLITPPGPAGGGGGLPAGHYATLWQLSPNIRVRLQRIEPTPGGFENFLWNDGPYAMDENHAHVIGITTIKYSFRSAGGGWYFTNPSGDVAAFLGRLTASNDVDVPPSSNFDSLYYIGPVLLK